jgi:hypothetical protein
VEFHVHTDTPLFVVGAMLVRNVTWKNHQLAVYAYRLFNKSKQNYNTTEREALTMVLVLHKFTHYLLGNKFVFYVDHMALVYLVNKPHVLGKIIKWLLLLFLEYDFIVMYKPSKTHVIADALSRLPDITKPIGVLDQTIDASLFNT